jgi:hypothetical protein
MKIVGKRCIPSLLPAATPDLQAPRLVVGTVGRRDELAELAEGGEPGLGIKLLSGSVVKLARNDGHDVIGKLELQ